MLSVLLLGLSLSMDAFAVSLSNGLSLQKYSWRDGLWMGLYFGFFQFFMPLLGFSLGNAMEKYVSGFGRYIAFFLLTFIGLGMIWDSFHESEQQGCTRLSHPILLAMAVATSIDAFAAGVSLAFMEKPILAACCVIGGVTFCVSFAGAALGGASRRLPSKYAGVVGGAVLVAIALKALLQLA